MMRRLLVWLGILKKKEEVTEIVINEPIEEELDDVHVQVMDDFVVPEPWNGKPTIAIDFDGVIHSYTSGWNGADEVDDPPISKTIIRSRLTYTSIDWLTTLVRDGRMNIAIFSSRNHQHGGIKAMKTFLIANGMEPDILEEIQFPEHKPPSHVLIDDRCMTFTGEFFSADRILEFKPWVSR